MGYKELVILAVLAVLILLALRFGKKKGDDGRAARLMKEYKTMTREKLDAVPDGELADAVVSRILAKAADSHRPDPVAELSGLPRGNTVVYSVWAVCKEMASSDFAALMTTSTKEVAELAAESFEEIGAPLCADGWRRLIGTGEDADAAQRDFRAAVQQECPLSLCDGYIRDHAEDFLDE